ncbi:MAG TPA: sigma-70 family RNA polymerase sigma factor [Gemmataceae bacterium]|jgi:RNA polymerase sigma factor (sigma-70 family)
MTKPALASVLHDLHRLAEMTGDPQQTDRQLLERFLDRRDETAFTVLVRRHGRLVLSACRRVLADEADIEDAFQATFLVLLRRASSVRWRESIGNWLFGVAHRIAVQARANAARRKRYEAEASRERQRPEEPADLSWREAVSLLHEELDRLPDAYRMPLLLCCLDGKTRDEAALALGCSAGSIKGRLERGREVLRKRLLRRGLALSGAMLAALVDAPAATTAPPPSLIRATLQAAATGRYPRSIARLIQGAIPRVFAAKMRIAAGVLLTIGLLAVGGSRAFTPGGADPATEPSAKQPQPNRAASKPADDEKNVLTLRGRVLGPDDKPVSGAKLYFPRWAKERRQGENDVTVVQRSTSDAKGRFRVQLPRTDIKAGQPHPLLAVAEGFGLAWIELKTEAPPGDVTLRLVKDVPVRGRLITTEGKPAAGVNVAVSGVMAFERLDDFLRVFQKETKHFDEGTGARSLRLPLDDVLPIKPTDKDGRFEINGIGVERLAGIEVKGTAIAPNVILVVTRADFDAKAFRKGAFRRDGDQVPPLFGPSFEHVVAARAVEKTRAIEGTVREAGNGKAVVGATVTAAGASAVTDARGRYRLVEIRKLSEYVVYITAPKEMPLIGCSVRVKAADTSGAEPMKVDAELMRGVVVTGRVYDKATGKGVRSSISYAALRENKTPKAEGLTLYTFADEYGRFRLVTVPGPGVVLASVPGTLLKIEGVPIYPYKPAAFDAADRTRIKMVDGKTPYGAFRTADGTVDLDLFSSCKVLDVKDGGAPVSCDLALDPGKTLTVELHDAEGKPLTGAVVAGVSAQTLRVVPFKTATSRIYALDPDHPRPVVVLHIERKLAAVVTLRGDEKEPVTVKLRPAATLTGRVLDADGQPVAGAEVHTLYTSTGRELTKSQSRWNLPRTDKEGRFRLEGIVPGLSLELGFVKGRQMLVPQTRREIKPPESGKTLDLGDMRIKPRP